jgi:hypothetical protein
VFLNQPSQHPKKKVYGFPPFYYPCSTEQLPVLVFLEQLKSEGESSAKSGFGDDFGTNINGDEEDDIASDVQEGARSTVGSLVQRNGVVRTLFFTLTKSQANKMLHGCSTNSSIMNPGRTMNPVLTMNLTDHHSATLAQCPQKALLARSVLSLRSYKFLRD